MRTITLEEHFVTRDFLRATGGDKEPALAHVRDQLLDLGPGRISAMDAAGIDLQVLSLAAIGIDALSPDTASSLIPDINDELAAAIKANPTRLAGFALLPLHAPEQAAAEFERCITKLGFAGAMIDGTTGGLFYDDPRFTPIWEAADHLGVPVYLHPAPPPPAVQQAYFSGLPDPLGYMLSIAGWGWHAETGLHTLRLITSGLFDRLPSLQLIIGHMGEFLPYALARSSNVLTASPASTTP